MLAASKNLSAPWQNFRCCFRREKANPQPNK
jgi:hypothetical protein